MSRKSNTFSHKRNVLDRQINNEILHLENDMQHGWTKPDHNVKKFTKLAAKITTKGSRYYTTDKQNEKLFAIADSLMSNHTLYLSKNYITNYTLSIPGLGKKRYPQLLDKALSEADEENKAIIKKNLSGAANVGVATFALAVASQLASKDKNIDHEFRILAENYPQAYKLFPLYSGKFINNPVVWTIAREAPEEIKNNNTVSLDGKAYLGKVTPAFNSFYLAKAVTTDQSDQSIETLQFNMGHFSGNKEEVLAQVQKSHGHYKAYTEDYIDFMNEAEKLLLGQKSPRVDPFAPVV